MESLQYFGRQPIPLRVKEGGNDNFTQVLLLRGKDNSFITERSTSTREHGSLPELSYKYYVKAVSQKKAI